MYYFPGQEELLSVSDNLTHIPVKGESLKVTCSANKWIYSSVRLYKQRETSEHTDSTSRRIGVTPGNSVVDNSSGNMASPLGSTVNNSWLIYNEYVKNLFSQ